MSASSLAAGLHWTLSIIVSFLIPVSCRDSSSGNLVLISDPQTMLATLGTYTFVVFAGLNLFFLVIVIWLMPETAQESIDVLTSGLLAIDG